ncbi:MAG: SDR family oxidoreductase [Anaerolineales bacterium]|nr:SDR family oxidoreductase [Anaerolineales bacterium]
MIRPERKDCQTWKDRIALITGASSGIGAATARRLAREGLRVILVARRRQRLEQVAEEIASTGGAAHTIPADLTQDNDRQRVYTQVTQDYGGVDVLVNNAGLGWYGFGSEMPWATALEMLQVNINATVHFTLLFLKDMKARGSGAIINIGSISGSLPSQGIALYGATKSFLDNFSTALYRELAGTPVTVSVVRAGPVRTEFCEAAAGRVKGLHLPTERMGVTSEKVAERIWGLLRRPRRAIYVPSFLAITPWVEASFGWLIDRIGPLLLKRQRP